MAFSIQMWNGTFFTKTSLQILGLRVQLGHGGAPCPCPSPAPPDFCIFDISGIHLVNVDFCGCRIDGLALHPRIQLLRAGWFPATFNRPKTAFTFDTLETFHELTLQGKTTIYDFYHTIQRKTDNLKVQKKIVRETRYGSWTLQLIFDLKGSLSRVSPGIPSLAASYDVEARRARARSGWCRWDV
jgi:hypothetical protein